ncbi:MAG: glutathione S-transferase family protein, partial [Gammaproteobacteria bacterium]
RHPLGRIPVLEDDGISIYESGAIIDYILEKHKNGGLKPSVNSSEYPYYLQWFHFCEGMIAQPMNTIVVHTLLLPPDRRDDVVLGQAKRLASKSLMAIEEALNGKDYLIGSFSGVEFMTGHCCTKLSDLGCVSDEMPNIQSYVKRIKERPAFQVAINTK